MRPFVSQIFIASLIATCVGMAWPSRTEAGPIRLGVAPAESVSGPALVRVIGHYASLHNGSSKHWKDALLPVGGRHFVALGPVNLLLNMGVSVRIVHPELLSASARSHSTPLLIRPVGFETFEPRTWRNVMASGEIRFGERPDTPAGHVLSQAYWHLSSILNEYLPALDSAAESSASSDVFDSQLAILEDIARYALDAPPPTVVQTRGMTPERHSSYTQSLAHQALESRVGIEDLLRQIREWSSLDRPQRRQLREWMEQMRHPAQVSDQLMTDTDRKRLGDFMLEVETNRSRHQDYNGGTSWVDSSTGIAYRVRILKPYGECARLNVLTDLTGITKADLDKMVHSVEARFCRGADGRARVRRS